MYRFVDKYVNPTMGMGAIHVIHTVRCEPMTMEIVFWQEMCLLKTDD